MSNSYIGSSLDDFLEEDGTLTEINSIALKRVLAWQVKQAMAEKKLTNSAMAGAMKTSLAALEQLLDPDNTSVTLDTMERAAKAVGKQLHLGLVDET